jgi:hypothetical protein
MTEHEQIFSYLDKTRSILVSWLETALSKLLSSLDISALLRVFDHNWDELRDNNQLSYEDKRFLKEMFEVCNRWVHKPTQRYEPDDTFRDLDTIQRFVSLIGANRDFITQIKKAKTDILASSQHETPVFPQSPRAHKAVILKDKSTHKETNAKYPKWQKVISLWKNGLKKGEKYDSNYLKKEFELKHFGTKNFQPSDYCYNITNKGNTRRDDKYAHTFLVSSHVPLFELCEDGEYRYLGEPNESKYTGECRYAHTKGEKRQERDELYGTWKNGVFTKRNNQ